MKGSLEVTVTVTESAHFLKVQHERFYPCPHSCQCRALWSTLSSNSPAPPVRSTDYPRTGWEHPCPLGAAPGAAGQGSQPSCSYQSQTEHNFSTDAISFRQFLPNWAHHTDQSAPVGNGLLSRQINLLPQTACLKPHTHRSREYYSDWAWEHIFQRSCCH